MDDQLAITAGKQTQPSLTASATGALQRFPRENIMASRIALTVMAGVATIVAQPGLAEAQAHRGSRDGSVQACSRYGHGCATAPVRRGAYGLEFRMPGGTWVNCRQDCKTALREELLDFWETQRERSGDRAR